MYGKFWIDRKLFDDPLWEDEPFTKAQAWIDLIGHANFDNTKVLKGYKTIEVKRGELFTTLKELSDRWGWPQTTTNDFLKWLESENRISQKAKSVGRLITIEKYAFYQGKNERAENKPKTSRKRAENKPKTSRKRAENEPKTNRKPSININKVNKDNKVNNNTRARAREDFASLINKQPEELHDAYSDFVEMRKVSNTPLTTRALELTISRVNKLSNGDTKLAKAIIEQSVQRSWRGVFPLKNDENPRGHNKVDIMDL